MRSLLWGALPWALMAQAPPLTFNDLQHRAHRSLDQLKAEALLAERQRALAGSQGLLREGPSLGVAAGPRTNPAAPTTSDQSVEVDLPLFLGAGARRRLEVALGEADPTLRHAARVEADFRLRCAYLDAWQAQERLRLREADLATARRWLQAARARLAAGADPTFQVSLVEGEILKAQLDLEEAQRQRALAWGALRALADLPREPEALADPGAVASVEAEAQPTLYAQGVLLRALALRSDLDQQTLRHQEALATSRWSLRGSYGREGEDRITKVGVAFRFTRPGEGQALRRETAAHLATTRRELEIARVELDARFQSTLQRLRAWPADPPAPDFDRALQAVGLRLEEGKERPSEALPSRRQPLDAQMALLARRHAHHVLGAELRALTEPEARPHEGARP